MNNDDDAGVRARPGRGLWRGRGRVSGCSGQDGVEVKVEVSAPAVRQSLDASTRPWVPWKMSGRSPAGELGLEIGSPHSAQGLPQARALRSHGAGKPWGLGVDQSHALHLYEAQWVCQAFAQPLTSSGQEPSGEPGVIRCNALRILQTRQVDKVPVRLLMLNC